MKMDDDDFIEYANKKGRLKVADANDFNIRSFTLSEKAKINLAAKRLERIWGASMGFREQVVAGLKEGYANNLKKLKAKDDEV